MNSRQNLRTFYTLILTQVLSLIGSRMTGLALGIYVFNQTGEATPLALTALFSFLPQVLVAGFAGALADRWDRRYVMVIADAGQAVGTLILMGTFVSGTFNVSILYAVTLVQSIFGVFQSPAFTASVTMLIPDNQRDRANAIQQLTSPAAGVVAPALAGLLYAAVGVSGVIVFDLVTFVVAMLVVLVIRIPRPAQTEVGRAMRGSLLKESFGGFNYLFQQRTLMGIILFISLVNFLFAGSTILFTPYILARTGSEATLGTLLSALNLGGILGGVIFGIWGGTRPRIHTILPGIVIGSIFLAVVGLNLSAVPLGIAMFLMMFPMPMVNATSMSLMQAKVPPDIQGRVFASMGQISMLLIPLSYLLVGPLADTVFEPAVGQAGWEQVASLVGNTAGAGMGLIMVLAGSVLTVATLLVYAIPRVRHMEAEMPDYVPEVAGDNAGDVTGLAAALD
jgi:MFS family permease